MTCKDPIAWKHADPTEDARPIYTEEDKAEIEREDPSLVAPVCAVCEEAPGTVEGLMPVLVCRECYKYETGEAPPEPAKADLLPLSPNERQLLQHVMRWGSDGYPIRKLRDGVWIWERAFGVDGAPVVYRTRKEAFSAFERWLDLAVDRSAVVSRG